MRPTQVGNILWSTGHRMNQAVQLMKDEIYQMQGEGRSIHGGVLGGNKLLKTLTRAIINAQREDYFLQ